MSTEHQQYSLENQSHTIERYAHDHGMQVVRTYVDSGKSGLTLQHRDGLRQLIHDVESGTAGVVAILVYDVSRWGRFQDADESAYYEYLCKRAKINVHYCAEPFENDGSLPATLLKTIKRTMASEYSRELSVKVFAGKCRLIELGFRQGGRAGYGLRRLLLDQDGTPKCVLKHGERKSIFTDRVILVPGPETEVQVVREIFECFNERGHSPAKIARSLNQRGLAPPAGRIWTRSMIRDMVGNPKYVGANVSNRISFKLSKVRVRNPPDMWVRREGAFEPLVSSDTFRRAQEVICDRKRHPTDEQLLTLLRDLLEKAGYLTAPLIDRAPGMPSSNTYQNRFKGVLGAYRRIGYVPPDDYSYFSLKETLHVRRSQEVAALAAELAAIGATVIRDTSHGILTVNDEFTLLLMLVRCRHTRRGSRWVMQPDRCPEADITVAARMAPGNESILDYYLFPQFRNFGSYLDLATDNGFVLDVHRFSDLSFLIDLARRQSWKEGHEAPTN